MTKADALHTFWAGFGLPAMLEEAVPDRGGVDYPYITYNQVTDSFEREVYITASIWDRTAPGYNATQALDAKVEEISNAIGQGGIWQPYDGGYIWIRRGSPFCNSLGDPSDDAIRRRVLNIVAEYWSI